MKFLLNTPEPPKETTNLISLSISIVLDEKLIIRIISLIAFLCGSGTAAVWYGSQNNSYSSPAQYTESDISPTNEKKWLDN